jgi:FKBP-type peptidyl-prolyl cis-trans isomerase
MHTFQNYIVVMVSVFISVFMIYSCEDDEPVKDEYVFLDHFNVQGKDTITTETGLQYVEVKEGSGLTAENGLIITFRYTAYLENDCTVVESSEEFSFRLGADYIISGLLEGLNYMKNGAKYKFILPPGLAFGENSYYNIPSNSTVVYDVEMQNIESDQELFTEKENLKEYIDTNNITSDSLLNGMYLIPDTLGTGISPVAPDIVAINYTARFPGTNEVFDTNIKDTAQIYGIYNEERAYEPLMFQMGTSIIIYGLQYGLNQMNEGGSARLILPSYLAYCDSEDNEDIPSYSTLIFDVELLQVTDR